MGGTQCGFCGAQGGFWERDAIFGGTQRDSWRNATRFLGVRDAVLGGTRRGTPRRYKDGGVFIDGRYAGWTWDAQQGEWQRGKHWADSWRFARRFPHPSSLPCAYTTPATTPPSPACRLSTGGAGGFCSGVACRAAIRIRCVAVRTCRYPKKQFNAMASPQMPCCRGGVFAVFAKIPPPNTTERPYHARHHIPLPRMPPINGWRGRFW